MSAVSRRYGLRGREEAVLARCPSRRWLGRIRRGWHSACRRRSVWNGQNHVWSDWSDERWQDGRWQNSLDLNLANRSWAEQHIKASWTAPNLTDGQLLGWQAENGRYRLDRCDRVLLMRDGVLSPRA